MASSHVDMAHVDMAHVDMSDVDMQGIQCQGKKKIVSFSHRFKTSFHVDMAHVDMSDVDMQGILCEEKKYFFFVLFSFLVRLVIYVHLILIILEI